MHPCEEGSDEFRIALFMSQSLTQPQIEAGFRAQVFERSESLPRGEKEWTARQRSQNPIWWDILDYDGSIIVQLQWAEAKDALLLAHNAALAQAEKEKAELGLSIEYWRTEWSDQTQQRDDLKVERLKALAAVEAKDKALRTMPDPYTENQEFLAWYEDVRTPALSIKPDATALADYAKPAREALHAAEVELDLLEIHHALVAKMANYDEEYRVASRKQANALIYAALAPYKARQRSAAATRLIVDDSERQSL